MDPKTNLPILLHPGIPLPSRYLLLHPGISSLHLGISLQDGELEAALKKDRERLASKAPLTESQKKTYPSPDPVSLKPVTSYKLLVVRLSFGDVACKGEGLDKFIFGSVAGYYKKVSGGAFSLSGHVAEAAVELAQTRETFGKYGLRSEEEKKVLGAALKLVDRTNFDGVAFVSAGKIGAPGSALWPHRWDLDGADFVVVPEDGGDLALGIDAHEIGHLFGLEDQYDDPRSDVGSWCLYGKGYAQKDPAPFCAGCRERLGWGPILRADPKKELKIKLIPGAIAKVPLNPDGKEYFLLEAREKSGLLAWHCGGGKSIELLGLYPSASSDRITPYSAPPFKARSQGTRDVWVTDIRFESGATWFVVAPSGTMTELEELRKSRVGKRLGD